MFRGPESESMGKFLTFLSKPRKEKDMWGLEVDVGGFPGRDKDEQRAMIVEKLKEKRDACLR
jgi:hypothetical protein